MAELQSLILAPLAQEVQQLRDRVIELEDLLQREQRVDVVGEVLVESVGSTGHAELGEALTPAMEEAVNLSARTDSTVLAEALYPVMGPAMRRMIANMFVPDSMSNGKSFRVQQLLLIERESGVLLASTAANAESSGDADVVSGMLDAIRLFVHEAFDTPEHDGLQDLRVGDTTVMVEWGPRAVLASVVRGIPTEQYRTRTAETLEVIHHDLGAELENFNGRVEPFSRAQPLLAGLYKAGTKRSAEEKRRNIGLVLAAILLVVLIVALVMWLR